MAERQKFLFKIEGVDLSDLPMRRVAEYVRLLSELLGHDSHVHMEGIKKGSVAVAHNIDASHAEEIIQTARDASRGIGPQKSNDVYQKMNVFLAEDKSVGSLQDAHETEIVQFPGRAVPALEILGPIEQEDSLDGVIMRIGGMTDEVPVWLRSGDPRSGEGKLSCLANRTMARQLAPYLFEKELRVFGNAKWVRHEDSGWKLLRFFIEHFEELDPVPLTVLAERLRDIPGNGWEKIEDPWLELQRERED